MEPWYRFAVIVIKPLLLLFTRRDFRGQEHIPATGGCIVVTNHISYADPFLTALYVHDTGRRPRFLAKASLFRLPVAKWVLKGAKQIPVLRETADAANALAAAIAAVKQGECLLIYPEGTVTKDPDYWPMLSKTGVARLALATGAPVVPVAQWGTQHFMGRDHKPHFRPRPTVVMRSNGPLDLSKWDGAEPTADVLREMTNHIMGEIADLVGAIRGEQPPAEPFVPVRKTA